MTICDMLWHAWGSLRLSGRVVASVCEVYLWEHPSFKMDMMDTPIWTRYQHPEKYKTTRKTMHLPEKFHASKPSMVPCGHLRSENALNKPNCIQSLLLQRGLNTLPCYPLIVMVFITRCATLLMIHGVGSRFCPKTHGVWKRQELISWVQ